LLPASATIGVIRPPGIETATEMSARLNLSSVSPVNWTLQARHLHQRSGERLDQQVVDRRA
jgi:hypothetical protein